MSNKLILLDFDGTLVPIANTPEEIEVSERVPAVLMKLLADGHEVYLITGRQRSYVENKLPGIEVPTIGLHGLEWPGDEAIKPEKEIDAARRELEALTEKFPCSLVEDKTHTVAFHFRSVDKKLQQAAKTKAMKIMKTCCSKNTSLGVLNGHLMLELRPKKANKARAVSQLVKTHPGLGIIFIGDDITDEEAMRALPKEALTIRVGENIDHTNAQRVVKNVDDVLLFLENLS